MTNVDDILQHYGVLGMRWGVRKERKSVSTGKKTRGSEDYRKSRELKRKGTKSLTTNELKELTTRLQLERQYKSLTPKNTNKGLDYVKKITAAGTTIAGLYALKNTPLGKQVTSSVSAAIKDELYKQAYRKAMGG